MSNLLIILLFACSLDICRPFPNLSKQTIVVAVWRGSSLDHCLGGVITSKSVLTSCSCVGQFIKTKKYWDFKLYSNRQLMLTLGRGQSYNIEKAVVHSHCRPATFNNEVNIYNLGAWTIEASFDMRVAYPMIPPKTSKISNLRAYRNFLKHFERTCYVFGTHETVKQLQQITMTLDEDFTLCTTNYCLEMNFHGTVDCISVHKDIMVNIEVCSIIKNQGIEFNTRGSPITCMYGEDEFKVLGIVSNSSENSLIWTRLDVSPNADFFEHMYLSVVPLRPSVFQAMLTIIITIFNKTSFK